MISRALTTVVVVVASVRAASAQCVGTWLDDYAFLDQSGLVEAIAVLPNGHVVAGGQFQITSGSVTLRNLALFDGENWQPLGSGVRSTSGQTHVRDITVTPTGDIVVVGRFDFAGTLSVNGIARWDGTAWSTFGTGLTSTGLPPDVSSVVALANGDIIAAGYFDHAGSTEVHNIARWDGETWHRLGNGLNAQFYANVKTLEVLTDGTLVAGGTFDYAGLATASNIAHWDGQIWHPFGSGIEHGVLDLIQLADGSILATTGFDANEPTPGGTVQRWDGASWSRFENFPENVRSARRLARLPSGRLVVAGMEVNGAMVWTGTQWVRIVLGEILDIAALPTGDLLASGYNTTSTEFYHHIEHFREFVDPVICDQPINSIPCLGNPATFSVSAGSIAPLNYRWQRNGIDLVDIPGRFSGTDTSQFTVGNTTFDDELDDYRCYISNDLGTVLSATAHVQICIGELTCTGRIGLPDLAILLSNFQIEQPVGYFGGDLNLDGSVDLTDLAMLLRNFGTRCD